MTAVAGGCVLLVGAGPGAPDLITVRGERALRSADVVVYDALASPELLALAPEQALRIDVGRRGHEEPARSQEDINALLLEHARQGRRVVRLKGGDPYVFGRGGEEASACRAAGIPFQVVPGVSSATAALSYAGIPVTDRRHSASFAVVTGHKDPTRVREGIRWRALAEGADTLVILMGMRNLPELVERLLEAGRSPDTPAAIVMRGTTPAQRVLEAPLGSLVERARSLEFAAPAAVVVGDVVSLREELSWFEALPLFGRRVLVTRQPEQAGSLCLALGAAGAEPVPLPMIRTLPVRDAPGLPAALASAGAYDFLLFTSANGVRELVGRASEAGVALPGLLRGRVLCVGPASLAAAEAAGFVAERLGTGGDAEALLDELRRRLDLEERRILLPRPERSRPLLAEGLREAGAKVDEVVVYRTERAPFDGAQLRRDLEQGRLDALSFASPSAVRNFAEGVGVPGLEAARSLALAAIGPVTAQALEDLGLPVNALAASPDPESLVAALELYFAGAGSSAGRAAQEEPR
jgi:uroporphyrinogen III methyltransferase/synthase